MIARTWRGWAASTAAADLYQRHFTSIDDVRAFAGEEPERAVVEDAARRVLKRWDERVNHHDVTVDLPPPSIPD